MTTIIMKYIKRPGIAGVLSIPLLSMLLSSCFSGKGSSAGGEVTGVGGSAWAEPTPYGMVLIDRGSIAMGPPPTTAFPESRPTLKGSR